MVERLFEDIVGAFRKELEHRMMLQDLKIEMSDLYVKAVVGRGSFGLVKLVYHKRDKWLGHVKSPLLSSF